MNVYKHTLRAVSAPLVALALSAQVSAQTHDNNTSHAHRHDMTHMPGLRGESATAEESAELAAMFRGFRNITREVSNLPNGIRTVTRSTDPALMDVITSHVTGMIARVENGDDPRIFIQSPTLDLFFARGDRIHSEIEVTDAGIVVTQTSDDPDLVEALQIHAEEVTAMVDQGMHAVHMMMMKRAKN